MNIKIFLENTTTIDFAVLPPRKGPVGKSLRVSVEFSGVPNSEGMLIDFSEAKTLVKNAISLCDHKLIISKDNICHQTDLYTQISISADTDKINNNLADLPFFAMYAKNSWFCILSKSAVSQIAQNNYADLEKLIEKSIHTYVPKNITEIKVCLSELASDFEYTHSLCNHTGNCQRFHGHSSQIKVLQNNVFNSELTQTLTQKLRDRYIISEKHLKPNFDTEQIQSLKVHCFKNIEFNHVQKNLHGFEYIGSDGSVSLIISKSLVLLLPYDSTIENIAQFLYDELPHNHNTEIRIYEGASKGAAIA